MSRRIRLILIGAGIVIVALLVYFLLISPVRGDIGELHDDIDAQDQLIQALEQELAQAAQTERDGRTNQARLIELSKMIPAEAEVPSLILQIQDLADRSGIDWIQVSPGQPTANEGLAYLTLPLSVNFKGTFYDVTDFIYRAEQMVAGPGRLLTVKDVAFGISELNGTNSPEMNIRMSIWAFVMPAEALAPAPAPDTTDTTEEEQ